MLFLKSPQFQVVFRENVIYLVDGAIKVPANLQVLQMKRCAKPYSVLRSKTYCTD